MDEPALYAEFGNKWRNLGLVIAGGALIYAVIEVALAFPNGALGLVVGILGTVIGFTLLGINRYSGITLTNESLRVGRELLTKDQLDRAFGVRGADALSDKERTAVELPTPIPKDASVRMLGGSYGRISGANVVVLREIDGGKKMAFSTKHPEDLIHALEAWLAT